MSLPLKRASSWPKGTLFYRKPMPSNDERSAWGTNKRPALADEDIVFLDPDNGIGRETEMHATFSEIRLLRKPKRGGTHNALPQRLHERLAVKAAAENVVTVRTNVAVPRAEGSRSYVQCQRWFTVVKPTPN